MIYSFCFGSTLPNSKMSIAQAVGHKPMTSAEFKSYESKYLHVGMSNGLCSVRTTHCAL
jgi:hypothetical protein